jgi:hypothetical protein
VVETLAPGAEAILELPLGGLADAAALYRSIFHRRPLVNGFSGHEPPHYAILRLGLDSRDHGVLTALAAQTPLYVVVDRTADADGSWQRWVSDSPVVGLVASDASVAVYHVPKPAADASPTTVTSGPRIPIRSVRANVNPSAADQLIDGDPRTRWQTGRPQSRRDRIVIDAGVVQPIESVVLSLGEFVRDFPRQLRIDVSADGSHWTEVWGGPTAGLALRGCLTAPSELPLRFSLGGQPARFVRLRQTADERVYHWSLVEIALYGREAVAMESRATQPER